MNFVRIFEDKKNKLVMIGLFLAILELVRERLITAEQVKPDMPIYLRALTDEPAEQAVQNAIMAQIEEEAEISDDYQQQNVIPIETIEAKQTSEKPPVPIKEIEPEIAVDTPLQVEQKQVLDDQTGDLTTEDNAG